MSGNLPDGPFAASATIRSATSPVSIGWNLNAFGAGSTNGTRENICRKPSISAWNCVARRFDHGTPDASISRSQSSFAL